MQATGQRRRELKKKLEAPLRTAFQIERLVGFGMVTLRDRRERLAALAALQIGEVQAQQVSGMVNEPAVWAPPFGHRDVVAPSAGHTGRQPITLSRKTSSKTALSTTVFSVTYRPAELSTKRVVFVDNTP
jgi:hypothetical protein